MRYESHWDEVKRYLVHTAALPVELFQKRHSSQSDEVPGFLGIVPSPFPWVVTMHKSGAASQMSSTMRGEEGSDNCAAATVPDNNPIKETTAIFTTFFILNLQALVESGAKTFLCTGHKAYRPKTKSLKLYFSKS